MQDATTEWWYGHNAVGFFLTAGFLERPQILDLVEFVRGLSRQEHNAEAAGRAAPARPSRWIPWTIGGVFLAIVAADAVMVTLAVRSDPGRVAGAPGRVATGYVLPTGSGLQVTVNQTAEGDGVRVEVGLQDSAGRRNVGPLPSRLGRRREGCGGDETPVPVPPGCAAASRSSNRPDRTLQMRSRGRSRRAPA